MIHHGRENLMNEKRLNLLSAKKYICAVYKNLDCGKFSYIFFFFVLDMLTHEDREERDFYSEFFTINCLNHRWAAHINECEKYFRTWNSLKGIYVCFCVIEDENFRVMKDWIYRLLGLLNLFIYYYYGVLISLFCCV